MSVSVKVNGVSIVLTDEQLKEIDIQRKKSIPVIERIKSYEDACEEQNIHPIESLPFKSAKDDYQDWINACHELYVVKTSLLEGKEINWEDSNEYKHYPYFDMRGAFSFNDASCSYDCAAAAARLCVDTEAKARHFGSSPKLLSIWKRFHGNKN